VWIPKRWWLSLTVAASPALAVPPLAQLPGDAGCLSASGSGGACASGAPLDGAFAVTVSPDGRNVYVAAHTSGTVVVFDRDVATGALTRKVGIAGCVSDSGNGGECANGVAMVHPLDVAVSPDGRNVYVAAALSDAVAIFDRDLETGAITQKPGLAACVSRTGTGGACAVGRMLFQTYALAVSPEGSNVYVTAQGGDGIAVFDRDRANGALTQKAGIEGCIAERPGGICGEGRAVAGTQSVVVSSDGRNVYTTSHAADAIAIFDRDPSTGALAQKAGTAGCISDLGAAWGCAQGHSMDYPLSPAISPDGRVLYLAAILSSAVLVLDRDPATGELSQRPGAQGCISETGADSCVDGTAVEYAQSLVVSPDGRSVYLAAQVGNAVAVFDRDPQSGALQQKAGVAACISDDGTGGACGSGRALVAPVSIATSPDGRNVYLAAVQSGALAAFRRERLAYDVDGDGEVEALTDALLLMRYQLGFRRKVLITDAVDVSECVRCTAKSIEAFIEAHEGP
jgi:DNA-binding beta-propeller fold protein YncE